MYNQKIYYYTYRMKIIWVILIFIPNCTATLTIQFKLKLDLKSYR